jgi:OOP family OmpA-OmpF porin
VYERLPDGKGLGIAQTNPETGEYELRLPAGQLYGVHVESVGKLSESQNLDLRDVTVDKEIKNQDFVLENIQVANIDETTKIVLNNVFFDFDKAVLKQESYPELNRIATLMKEKGSIEVEIAGHTDATGDTNYNLGLSKRRANAVAQYLINQGVAKDKIQVAFFGETKPVESNDTADGRKKNRRVEFRIIKL